MGREGAQGQGTRSGGRFPSGEAQSRVPAATANRRAANTAEGTAEPLLWGPPCAGYCPILLRSWWPAALPATLESSSWEISGSASCGGVRLVGAGGGFKVEVRVVGGGVEVVTEVVGARVVG